jgi:hypothetical protein
MIMKYYLLPLLILTILGCGDDEQSCGAVYTEYKGIYNANLSFICEDAGLRRYVHFNE